MPHLCPQKKPTTGLWITIREIFVINCQQEEVELRLKLSSYFFQVTNTLIVLDDFAPSKDVKDALVSWFLSAVQPATQASALGF